MQTLDRAQVAFITLVIAVGVVAVLDILFAAGIGDFAFSPVFASSVFVVAFIFAPTIAHRFPLRRPRAKKQ
jgi:hypothetical protein